MLGRLLLLLLGLAALQGCSNSGDRASDAADGDVEAADAIPADAPDATDSADVVATDTDVDAPQPPSDVEGADVPPAPTWTLTVEAAEPATDAWARVTPIATDEDAGTVTVALEVSPFASLLGLSFHVGLDPARAEIVDLSKIFVAPDVGSTTWGLLARSERGAIRGGLGVLRRTDPMFGGGGGGQLSGTLPAATVLYHVKLKLLAAGTLTLSLDFPDTVAVAPDWTALPLERLGLTVTATREVAP
jgi:hypothetical protein